MKQFFENEPVIFSTGGGTPGRLQDTIQNMNQAISLGADVLRSNVAMTADKKIILYSDDVFKNQQMLKSGFVSLSLTALRGMHKQFMSENADDDECEDADGIFPELADVLSAYPGQRFNLNFPDPSAETVETAAVIISELNADQLILASSMHGRLIKKIRSLLPETPTTFSFPGIVGFYALYRSGFLYFFKKFAADALVIHEMIGASFIGSQGLIGEAKKRGMRVYMLNVNAEDQTRRFQDAGADGYVTGSIEMVLQALGQSRFESRG
ncbi:MAG: hypothetical protein JXA07_09610 [Spirochaetes bacterium]|nr:hypothetical protein [Spirochaetota bacterium]